MTRKLSPWVRLSGLIRSVAWWPRHVTFSYQALTKTWVRVLPRLRELLAQEDAVVVLHFKGTNDVFQALREHAAQCGHPVTYFALHTNGNEAELRSVPPNTIQQSVPTERSAC